MIRYHVISPDGLPIEGTPKSYKTEALARTAMYRWCLRFAVQGYYAAVDGRIELHDLPARCTIVPKGKP